MRRIYTVLGRTRLDSVFILLLNSMGFLVWVVTWLCLAHLGDD